MSRRIDLFAPVPAELVQRVEDAKADQANDVAVALAGLAFDDVVYFGAKEGLRKKLESAANFGTIHSGSKILTGWKDLCMAQIPEVVDLWLQRLFNIMNPMAGHDEYSQGRSVVLSPSHDHLAARASRLVDTVEGDRWGRDTKFRRRAVSLVAAGRMNRFDWNGLARDYVRTL